MDGLTSSDGRVEVCYDNHFGTVCEENWTNEEATIVCSQLGFGKEGKKLPQNMSTPERDLSHWPVEKDCMITCFLS